MKYSSDDVFEDAESFINYFLTDKKFRTRHIFDAHHLGQGGFVFRGQSNAKWSLLPTAFRDGQLDLFTPQPPGSIVPDEAVHLYLGFQLHAEARAVHIFLECADELGIPTPLDYTTTNHGIELISAAFDENKEFDYTCAYPPTSFERATALAQHFGVPTRFLDWSESPLVAIYFAAYNASSFADVAPDADQEIAIYYFYSDSSRKKDSPVSVVRAPRHENSNLLRQKGLFAVIKNSNQFFLNNARWPTMEDVVSKSFQLHRARLAAGQADNLLRKLYDLDITRHSLMPSLENAARSFSYARKLFKTTD